MRCDRCSAEGDKPHPAGGFIVTLEEISINNSKKVLCQKCKARELLKTDKSGESNSSRLSIRKLIDSLFS